jgi:hypothetical protein
MPSPHGFTTPEEDRQIQLNEEQRRRQMDEERQAKDEARQQELEKVQRVSSEISRDFAQATRTPSPILNVSGTHAPNGRLNLEVETDSTWYEQAGSERYSKLCQIRDAFQNAMGLPDESQVTVWDKARREAEAIKWKKLEDERRSRRNSSSSYTGPGEGDRQGHGL